MSGHFIDFIRIQQTHAVGYMADGSYRERLPVVEDGIVYKFQRDETGEFPLDDDGNPIPVYESVSRRFITGSYDSLYVIRCDGAKVEFEGNVGRFCRPDNLFNLDFDATIQKVNEILATYGLPPFSAGESYEKSQPSAHDIKHGLLIDWTGATVSEVHITQNFITGSAGNAQAAIDWLSTQSVSHVKRTRAHDTTVSWGRKAGRKYLKAYLKAPEMLVHRHGRNKEEIEQDPVYQYAHSHGILRFELEAKRLLLRDNHCRFLGEITMQKLAHLFEEEVQPLLGRVKEDISRLELESLPAPVRMTASAYLRGENVAALLSRRTFYRHLKALRDYGLDISEPLPTLHKFSPVINVVQIQPVASVPDWYWQHQRRMTLRALPQQEAA
ncbi:phage/plasmid replication protein, II/X family [Vogesella sp. DC21W]|uniref:Phage/plasmid replication protein, II/X family n=1 Tax=Vogesella aquatica TaxID=2984206 RepID=A0ABT5J3X0_9NEIS|nr:phage/plasmid replication protein, II/X family [Vogesella aquatica]MDC7718654.1 phage/plasmid replication protein, II/X family [Vogesella aquatica]